MCSIKSCSRLLLLILAGLFSTGCLNHFLVHPRSDPPEVESWSERVDRGDLRMRVVGARPVGEGLFPGVLVHPEANHEAREMRGIVRSLAREGYVAIAVDYKRRMEDGSYREPLFVWREPEDPLAAFEHLRGLPGVDTEKIGAMGFSQGGVYSLIIAAETEDRKPGAVDAVVAYYPVTDFVAWLDLEGKAGIERFVYRMVRKRFRQQAGVADDAELDRFLERASAMARAESIEAPVLLIHGDRDPTAPVSESRQLTDRLEALDHTVRLEVVEGAGHVFNFKQRSLAADAWSETVAWLDEYLQ